MTTTTSNKKWYVLRAISGKEKKVKQAIEDEIIRNNLQNYVSQVLIPTEKVLQIKGGKKVTKERSYFPGYILIEAELVGEVPHILKNINGVIGFLGAEKGGDPLPLRPQEVNRILGKVDELNESEADVFVPFQVGELVKIIDGPFNGFVGTVEKIMEDKKKLEVMVKIFGRKQPIELSFLQVEREQ
ncbi:MAG: transcription termination/antitermination protein NusG [Vicingaceae bacterium]|nr:MAG: transcription termination/antitermination protein NusG [Vicingaceae bacterium]